MKKALHNFLHWWETAPFYLSVWFIPIVLVIFVIAAVKNIIIGDKK